MAEVAEKRPPQAVFPDSPDPQQFRTLRYSQVIKSDLDPWLGFLGKRYRDESIPLKVRKTRLLGDVGLTVPRTDYFCAVEVDAVEAKLKVRLKNEPAIIVRFACTPDRFSMPTRRVERVLEIDSAIKWLRRMLVKHSRIKSILLQGATPVARMYDKVVGRLAIYEDIPVPWSRTLELFTGATSAAVFNRVEQRDPRYLRAEQRLGEYFRPITSRSTLLMSAYLEVVTHLSSCEDAFCDALSIVKGGGADFHKHRYGATFEFSYRDHRMVFVDVD